MPRAKNKHAYSKQVSIGGVQSFQKKVLVKVLPKRSIEDPIIETLAFTEEEDSRMTPYIIFLTKGTLHVDEGESQKVSINATQYTMYEARLYRKGYYTPWLKCITKKEA